MKLDKNVKYDSILIDKMMNNKDNIIFQSNLLDFLNHESIIINNNPINIKDDIWDLSNVELNGKLPNNYIFSFDKIKDSRKSLIKIYMINRFLEKGIYITTNKRCLMSANNILTYFEGIGETIQTLRVEDIKEYITKNKNLSIRTISQYKLEIKDFLEFYSQIFNFKLDEEIDQFLDERDIVGSKTELKNNKTLLPSHEFMKNFVELLEKDFDNETDQIKLSLLGLLIIVTQTGIRLSELFILRKDALVKHPIVGKDSYSLFYYSTKNKGTLSNTLVETTANYLVVKVIFKLRDYNTKNENLVDDFINANLLNKFKNEFCTKYADELNIKYVNHHNLSSKVKVSSNNYIYVPTFKQFRVYFSTDLSRRGVNDIIIAKFLNHTDPKMWGYYTRSPYEIQENTDFTKFKLEEILMKDLKILGPRGNEYNRILVDYKKDIDIKVKDNLEGIIKNIVQNIPIRQKLGGFCMKPNPNRECVTDAETDEFYCAFQMCPNQCHTVLDIDYHYNQYNNFKTIIETNMKNGFINSAQKEIFKITNLVNTKLKPELNEIKCILSTLTQFEIQEKFNNLSFYFDNFMEIEKEITKWENKII